MKFAHIKWNTRAAVAAPAAAWHKERQKGRAHERFFSLSKVKERMLQLSSRVPNLGAFLLSHFPRFPSLPGSSSFARCGPPWSVFFRFFTNAWWQCLVEKLWLISFGPCLELLPAVRLDCVRKNGTRMFLKREGWRGGEAVRARCRSSESETDKSLRFVQNYYRNRVHSVPPSILPPCIIECHRTLVVVGCVDIWMKCPKNAARCWARNVEYISIWSFFFKS